MFGAVRHGALEYGLAGGARQVPVRWGVVVFGLAGLDTAGKERSGSDGEVRLFGLGAVWRVLEWMVRQGRNGMEIK